MTAPWERQPGESRASFEAFEACRNLGPARTRAGTAKKLGKPSRLRERWSSKRHWVFRSDQWDVELRRIRDGEAKERATKEGANHERITREAIAVVGSLVDRLHAKI